MGGLFQVEPKYMLAGGVMGALITYTVIKSVGTLGPAKIRASDCSGSDYCCLCHRSDGAFGVDKVGFEWKKAIGALVAIAGIIIFRW